MISSIFWHPVQQRLRAFWRLLVFLLLAAVVANPLVIALDATGIPWLERSLVNLLIAIGFGVALWVSARYTDRRSLSDFGLALSAVWWRDFGAGFAIGTIVMSLLFLGAYAAGWVDVQSMGYTDLVGVPFLLAFAGQLVRYAAGSYFEELMSRSYLLRIIAEGLAGKRIGKTSALMVSWVGTSLLFGALHLANPNATVLSAFNITLLGMLFGLGMVYTGRLALPIGLHMSWNVFQNAVFGLPNSGQPSQTTIWVTEVTGPDLWMGGPFGPEGGLLTVAAAILGGVLVWWWLYRHYGKPVLHLALADPPVPGPVVPQSTAPDSPSS